jgi:outer membrane protein TolC
VRTQELALEQAAQQLRFDVTDAYYAVQQADSQVEIARAAVADAEQSLRDAELLEQAGLGTRFDVLQAEVDLANEEQNLTRARSQRRISRRRLVETLGLGQQVEVTAATPPEVAGTWELSLEESIVLAYQNRSELEQQLEQREIAEENEVIALAGIRPQVSLFTRYNVRDIIDSPNVTGAGDGLAIGAQLQWTLYDGGQARARAQQAKENAAIAENRFDQTRNQIRREVEQAFYNLQANEQNIDTARVAVEQGEESLRLARLRFQAGVGTQTDVINAQSALTQARGNLLTAIIDYNRSLAALQRAVSNLPDSRLFDTP